MRRSLVIGFLLGCAVAWGGPLTAAEDKDVFLLLGQSNLDGRGQAADLPADLRGPNPAFSIFYRNPPFDSGGWKPLAPGFSVPPGYKGTTLPSPTFGCELTFAPTLATLDPGLHIALIKASKGGTSLNKDWRPGASTTATDQGPCYQNFLATVAAARTVQAGTTLRLRGMVWHQGESDAGMPDGAYRKLLVAFIARVRADVGIPDLPVVVGEVFDNGKRDFVRAAQRGIATQVPRSAFVSCEGLATFDKGTHFDAAGQLELGRRYAKAMHDLLAATASRHP